MTYIKINPKKVYDLGTKYEEHLEHILSIQNKLNKFSDDLKSKWSGTDNKVFITLLNEHIASLSTFADELSKKSDVIKMNAQGHNNTDDNFSRNMRPKEVFDEYRKK